jgi:hypothetical protein
MHTNVDIFTEFTAALEKNKALKLSEKSIFALGFERSFFCCSRIVREVG